MAQHLCIQTALPFWLKLNTGMLALKFILVKSDFFLSTSYFCTTRKHNFTHILFFLYLILSCAHFIYEIHLYCIKFNYDTLCKTGDHSKNYIFNISSYDTHPKYIQTVYNTSMLKWLIIILYHILNILIKYTTEKVLFIKNTSTVIQHAQKLKINIIGIQ